MSEASRTPEMGPLDPERGIYSDLIRAEDFIAVRKQRDAALERERGLRGALQRAIPALWIMATSGNADAIAIHDGALAALAAKGEK